MHAARCAIPQLAGLEQKQMEAGLAAARAGVAGAQKEKQAPWPGALRWRRSATSCCAPRAFAQSRNSHARFAATQAAAATRCAPACSSLCARCARQS